MAQFPIKTKSNAQCTDCYRCLRKCPIDAIEFATGKARIIQKKCVLCGDCVKECPQNTKYIITDFAEFKEAYDAGKPLVLSVGETVGTYFRTHPNEVLNKCRQLNFVHVEETDVMEFDMLVRLSEYMKAHRELLISSHCPVVVNLIEQHYPHLIPFLIPFPTLPTVHALDLKARFPEAQIVHVTSCLGEVNNPRTRGAVDYVIDFKELDALFDEYHIKKSDPDLPPAEQQRGGYAFSIIGTMEHQLMDFGVVEDAMSEHFSGLKNCIDILDDIDVENPPNLYFLELLACPGGCVNGMHLDKKGSILEKCLALEQYECERAAYPAKTIEVWPEAEPFQDRRYVMPAMDKTAVADEMRLFYNQMGMKILNCGACGYDTCRRKNEAVVRGEASRTMCMSYMRASMESFAGAIVANSDEGIVVFDNRFHIMQMNPKFVEMFGIYGVTEHASLRSFMNVDFMMDAVVKGEVVRNHIQHFPDIKLSTQVRVVPLSSLDGRYYASFADITDLEENKRKLEAVKGDLLHNANKVIDEQMRAAQEIAMQLGETTAATKITLLELIKEFER